MFGDVVLHQGVGKGILAAAKTGDIDDAIHVCTLPIVHRRSHQFLAQLPVYLFGQFLTFLVLDFAGQRFRGNNLHTMPFEQTQQVVTESLIKGDVGPADDCYSIPRL